MVSLALGSAALAQTRQVHFDIPAADLNLALKRYALQANEQISFPQNLVAGLRSAPLTGEYTPETALAKLLAGADLVAERSPKGVIILHEKPRAAKFDRVVMTGAGVAAMQTGVATAPAPEPAPDELEQVVVTATRQTSTVNRVPMSVSAATQRNLDQQGIRTITDLQGTVPALQVTQQLGSGVGNFAIRGIVQSPAGAATTGFYLDDTPLQKRNVAGGFATSNGTPLPPLFDLDRVEVLRGPQGTLFGGSSEGGTIRYIQPQPSLTRFSEYARAQYSTPKKGEDSWQVGAAVGGPIVQDKLGFRVSVFRSHTGGFIDLIEPMTGQLWSKNTGDVDVKVLRAALTWAVTDRARLTLSYLTSQDKTDNNNTSYTIAPTGAVTMPTTCYNTALYSAASPPPGGVPRAVATTAAGCAAAKAANPAIYILPGASYGPYNLDRYQSLAIAGTPTKTNLQVGTLTFDYDFGPMTMRSITSYFHDVNKGQDSQSTLNMRVPGTFPVIDPITGDARTGSAAIGWNPIFGALTARDQGGRIFAINPRYGFTQEVRFSSAPDRRFSWVGGVFYSNIRNPQIFDAYYPMALIGNLLYGFPNSNEGVRQRFGVQGVESAPGLANNFSYRRQRMKDVEVAAFAEGNYWIVPDKLRATVGLRVSRVTFDFSSLYIGPATGVGPDAVNPAFRVAGAANGGFSAGSTSESPVTPKVGLQYNFNADNFVYTQAAKGFRPGGVNPVPAVAVCQLALNTYGLEATELPQNYKSDTVWSYEAGGKFRLFNNRVQLNGAVYRIDWKDPQVTISPGFQCGLVSTYNADAARSEGFELEAQARLFRNLTLNGSIGYENSRYTSTTVGVTGRASATNNFIQSNLLVSQKGQKLPVAPWTIGVGARYDVDLTSAARGYLRVDWRYTSSYDQFAFGIGSFSPDANLVPTRQNTNIRLGVEYGDFDLNLFVNNLFDRKTGVVAGGRSGCATPTQGGTAACTTYSNYTPFYQINTGYPREIGIQIAYRH